MRHRTIRKILIVGNDEGHLNAMSDALNQNGYDCRTLSDTSQALHSIDEFRPDIVISDIDLSETDALALMCLTEQSFHDVDFLIITHHPSRYTCEEIIKKGATDYMVRPFELDELIGRIHRIERDRQKISALKPAGKFSATAPDRNTEKNDESEKASLVRNEFLAGLTHELRIPLNGIIGYTDILFDTGLTDEQADYVRTIKLSGETILLLINDILDSARIEAGGMTLERIDFDPEVLCFNVCDIIRPRLRGKQVEILCRIGDTVPAVVSGDPHRFRQVLLNLMGNAAKFTESGEIELSLDVEKESEGRIKLMAVVRDTGIGIPADKLNDIFEPFKQADRSISRKYGGTGLGLSICRKIAKLMEGDVRAESAPGRGSTFFFLSRHGMPDKEKIKRGMPVDLKNKTAMIVEENQANQRILSWTLATAGMNVITVGRCDTAILKLQQAADAGEPFDICIIDVNMPQNEGFELAKQIKHTQTMPVVSLLAFSSPLPGAAKKCGEAGFDGFLPKPVRKENLFQMLRQLIMISGKENLPVELPEKQILTQHSVREDMKRSVKILIAEDNPVSLKLAAILLKKAGYSVDTAQNGEEAFNKYTASPSLYDLVLMDIQMPVMSGIEAAKAIRRWERSLPETPLSGEGVIRICTRYKEIPIVAMTGNVMDEDRKECADAGMNDYIAKPVKREVVFEVIARWVLND